MNNQWENTWLFIGYCHYSTRHFRNEKGTGAKTCTAMVSGIVTGDAPVSYWSIFSLSLTTVPEVCAKVNSAQFPSQMAHCSNTAGGDAMRYITLPTHLLQVLYTFYSRHHQGPALGWVFSTETSRYQWCLQQTGKLIWKRISAVGLSHLIELIIASSRRLFQLVLRKQNNKFIKKN